MKQSKAQSALLQAPRLLSHAATQVEVWGKSQTQRMVKGDKRKCCTQKFWDACARNKDKSDV